MYRTLTLQEPWDPRNPIRPVHFKLPQNLQRAKLKFGREIYSTRSGFLEKKENTTFGKFLIKLKSKKY